MSQPHIPTGSRSTAVLPERESVTLSLYTVVGREELNIVQESQHSLAITTNTYRDGDSEPRPDRRHFNLLSEAAVLRYAISDNTDVERLWQIDVVYGSRPALTTVEYLLKHERDAFRFQRLITGYSPYRRFSNVSASALEQHFWGKAKDINISGEAQVWSFVPLEPEDEQPPTSPAPPNLQDKGMSVTMAKPPPLLLIFAGNETTSTYKIMRVDITHLKIRPSRDPNTFDLISLSGDDFLVHVLSVTRAESWNICKLRPGVYSKLFKRHECNVLTLRLKNQEEVDRFRCSFLVLQALAAGAGPSQLLSIAGGSIRSVMGRDPNGDKPLASPTEISDDPDVKSQLFTDDGKEMKSAEDGSPENMMPTRGSTAPSSIFSERVQGGGLPPQAGPPWRR